jgi:hypothetical protein
MKEETKGINALLIFEVVGRPPEHLTATLNKIIEEIDKERGISVKEKKLNEPVPMKENKDFFIAFGEIEVNIDDFLSLIVLMFKYMPAHIEIISPELVALTNNSWNDILNELVRRLHTYDEVARVMQVEKAILQKRLAELMQEKEQGNKEKPEAKEKPRKKIKKGTKKPKKK